MSRLFPFRTEPDLEDRESRLLSLDDDAADDVFAALASKTARRILLALHEEPRPASEIAEAVDTSVQNVQYHLGKLQGADLVEVVDTWYSRSGTEMKVYAPSDRALVLVASDEPVGALQRLAERLVGAVVPVVAAAVIAIRWYSDREAAGTNGGTNMSTPLEQGSSGVDPVVVAGALFAGALLALGGYLAVRHLQRRREPRP